MTSLLIHEVSRITSARRPAHSRHAAACIHGFFSTHYGYHPDRQSDLCRAVTIVLARVQVDLMLTYVENPSNVTNSAPLPGCLEGEPPGILG